MVPECLATTSQVANQQVITDEPGCIAIMLPRTIRAPVPAERRAASVRISSAHQASAFTLHAGAEPMRFVVGPISGPPSGLLEPETEQIRGGLRVA